MKIQEELQKYPKRRMRNQEGVDTLITFGKSLGDGKNNEPEVKPLVVSSVPEWYLYLLCTKLESNIYNLICFPQNTQFHQILKGEINMSDVSKIYVEMFTLETPQKTA